MRTPAHEAPVDPVSSRWLRVIGGALLCLAGTVLIGRFTGLTWLVRAVPGGAPMAFVAAIGFALSGGAFLAFAAGWLRAGRWLGVACGALGAGTLGLYAVVAWR
ncbi:MAG TPA: hypothetical protein VGD81_00890, partial [Opitutaceae bacterium]